MVVHPTRRCRPKIEGAHGGDAIAPSAGIVRLLRANASGVTAQSRMFQERLV